MIQNDDIRMDQISAMKKLLLSICVIIFIAQAALANEDEFEAKCLAAIKAKYREPAQVTADAAYSKMKLIASFWLDKKGRVSGLTLQRDHQICFMPLPGEQKAKPAEKDYIVLSSQKNTEAAEQALLDAINNAQPFSVAGIKYPAPYPIYVSYAPGDKAKWILSLSPPPAAPPLSKKASKS